MLRSKTKFERAVGLSGHDFSHAADADRSIRLQPLRYVRPSNTKKGGSQFVAIKNHPAPLFSMTYGGF